MHSIVTTFRGAVIKVEVANFCAAMDTLIDQDVVSSAYTAVNWHAVLWRIQLVVHLKYIEGSMFKLLWGKKNLIICGSLIWTLNDI